MNPQQTTDVTTQDNQNESPHFFQTPPIHGSVVVGHQPSHNGALQPMHNLVASIQTPILRPPLGSPETALQSPGSIDHMFFSPGLYSFNSPGNYNGPFHTDTESIMLDHNRANDSTTSNNQMYEMPFNASPANMLYYPSHENRQDSTVLSPSSSHMYSERMMVDNNGISMFYSPSHLKPNGTHSAEAISPPVDYQLYQSSQDLTPVSQTISKNNSSRRDHRPSIHSFARMLAEMEEPDDDADAVSTIHKVKRNDDRDGEYEDTNTKLMHEMYIRTPVERSSHAKSMPIPQGFYPPQGIFPGEEYQHPNIVTWQSQQFVSFSKPQHDANFEDSPPRERKRSRSVRVSPVYRKCGGPGLKRGLFCASRECTRILNSALHSTTPGFDHKSPYCCAKCQTREQNIRQGRVKPNFGAIKLKVGFILIFDYIIGLKMQQSIYLRSEGLTYQMESEKEMRVEE